MTVWGMFSTRKGFISTYSHLGMGWNWYHEGHGKKTVPWVLPSILTQPRKDRRCFATEKNTSPGLAQAFPVSKNIGKQHPRRFPACHTNVPCLTTMHPLVSSSSGVAAKVLTTGDLMVASTTDPGPNGPNVAPGHQIRLRWPFAFRFQRWQHDLRDVAQTWMDGLMEK